MSLLSKLRQNWLHPNKIAFIQPETNETISYATLQLYIDEMISILPRNKTFLLVTDQSQSWRYAALLLATMACGVAMPFERKGAAIATALDRVEAPCVITMTETNVDDWFDACKERLLPSFQYNQGKFIQKTPNNSVQLQVDYCLILSTSGTTFLPKRVPLTATQLLVSIENIIRCYELNERDICLLLMPLVHVHGMIGCLFTTLMSHGTVLLPNSFHVKQYVSLLQRATWSSAVPTIYERLITGNLIQNKVPFPKLRFLRSASSPLHPKTFHAIQQWTGKPIHEAYAMTEAAHQMTGFGIRETPIPGTVGHCDGRFGAQIKILHENQLKSNGKGEICVFGPTVIPNGYLPEKSFSIPTLEQLYVITKNETTGQEERYLRTGDLGSIENGLLKILGREKDRLVRNGYKLDPAVMESALLENEGVQEAVVFGWLKENSSDQVICVALVLKENVSVQQIQNWWQNHYPKWTLPDHWFVTTEPWPRTATGKTQRNQVASYFKTRNRL